MYQLRAKVEYQPSCDEGALFNNVYETIAPFGTLRIAKSLYHIKKKRNEQNFNNNLFRAFNSKLL